MFSNVSFHNDPGQLLCGCGNVVACAFTPVDRLLCSETGIQMITILLFFLGAVRFHLAKFLKFPKFSITCTYTVLSLVKVPWFIFHDSAHSGHLSGWIVNIFKMHLLRNEKACFDFEWRRHLTVALLQVNSWLILRGISKTTQLLPFTELTYLPIMHCDIAWYVGPLDWIAFSLKPNRSRVRFQSSRDHLVQAI